MHHSQDTIAAIATAAGRGGIGVIRVSGTKAESIVKKLCGKIPPPRLATLASFKSKENQSIDQGVVLYFPAPASFTGESVVEFHGHGGAIVLDQILNRLLQCGARLAQPGEFSQRAFLNNKIDLAQAEAIADLIDASSQTAAQAAIRSLQGEFSNRINQLLAKLIELRVYVESAIDFPEEEIDFISEGQVGVKTKQILSDVESLIASATQGKLLREGLTVVIAGKPNAGKSSLLNALSGFESAIVTEIPGTTRDVVKETIVIDGLPINIIDTAGLRESDDPVEIEGIRRAKKQIQQADCVLNIIDSTQENTQTMDDDLLNAHDKVIAVYNKIDLLDRPARIQEDPQSTKVYLSAKKGEGIELLRQILKKIAGYEASSEGVFIARRRHLDALERARININNGLTVLVSQKAAELLAEDLLHAQTALNEITGEFTSDDLLGEIFSTFCIGK